MSQPIAIIMGSDSDLPVLQAGIDLLEQFGVGFKVQVVSAHRTPEEMLEFGTQAEEKGFKVIIAAAGGAAHLPGMVASVTSLPVIGVPVNITSLEGIDSLLSIMQMPKGVPVATVSIDNSINAALLALRILGTFDSSIAQKVKEYRENQKEKVTLANKKLQE